MGNKNTNVIVVFSINLVFIQIIERIMEKANINHTLLVLNSFSDIKKISKHDTISLILVDDLIIGTSSYELINNLRLVNKISCPIIYFGVSEHNGEKKSILSVPVYYFFHLNEILLHAFQQPELCPCPLKILSLKMDTVIGVPVEVIGQKTQTDDIGHEFS